MVEGRENVRGVTAESGEGVEFEHSMAWEGLVELLSGNEIRCGGVGSGGGGNGEFDVGETRSWKLRS